jgi:tetratricopeptide (TPR) repeat protein
METLDPWAIYQYGKDDSPSELQEILDLLGKARKKHPLWSYFIDDYRTRILAKLDRFEECDEILKALLETRFFDRLAASNHEESRVYGNLAGIQHRKGNQNEAIRLALQSIGFFPRPHSYLVLAAAYYEKKEFQNSIDISLKALDIITPEYMAGLEKRFRQIIEQAKQWMEYEEN